jgi:hypothetical protein
MADTYPIKKIHIIDILPSAAMFDDCFSKQLQTPPVGIYVRNEIKPRMVPFQHYRQTILSDSPSGGTAKAEVPLTHMDLELIETAVFNEVGECVIPARQISMLTTLPNLPVVAINMICELMQNRLTQLQSWPTYGGHAMLRQVKRDYDIIAKYLNTGTLDLLHQEYGDFGDDSNPVITIDLFEDMLAKISGLFQKMASFVNGETWTVHFMDFIEPMAIKISKSIDYRIADWHIRNGLEIDY